MKYHLLIKRALSSEAARLIPSLWRLTGIAFFCLVSSFASFGENTAASPQHESGKHTHKQITIGDIVISNFTASRAVQGPAGFHITGSGTTAVVPDSPSKSTLTLHADEIGGAPEGKDAAGNLELSGHVSFMIDQTQKGDKRHISGTAGHIKMRRSEGIVRLSGIVHVTVTDNSTLSEPALVTSESALIDLKSHPYRLTTEGSEQISDIVFVPRPRSSEDSRNRVHISQFSHGDFQPGEAAAFSGSRVRAEVTSTSTGDTAQLFSSSIVSEFDQSVLTAVVSKVPVTYHAEQRLTDGAVSQSADGSAKSAELRIPGRLLLLTGNSRVRIYNAAHLVGPGTLVSDLAKLDLSARPYRYSADGAADVNSLQFTVSPPTGKKESPLSVHIFGYLRMVRSTEQIIEFTGPYTTLDITRQMPRGSSHILCSSLTVRMSPGNQFIERIVATDHVQFRLSSAITPTQDRRLIGTADRAEIDLPPPAVSRSRPENGSQKLTMHTVNCKLEAPDLLVGEATIRADDVEQVTTGGQTRLTVTGDVATNDIFAPLRSGTGVAKSAQSGMNALHLYRFQRAQMSKDGSLVETGPHSMLDISQLPSKRNSHIQSDQIDVSVDPVTKSPMLASAHGRVSINSEQTAAAQPGSAVPKIQSLAATCERAVYDLTLQRIVMDGAVNGRVTDSIRLAEPCDVRADTVTIGLQTPYSTLKLHDVGGRPSAADIRLAVVLRKSSGASTNLVPQAKLPQKNLVTSAPRFMRLHLHGFRDAEFDIGVGASAEGVGTTLDADRSDGASRLSLSSPAMSLRLSGDGQVLDSAEASGQVMFDARSISESNVQSVHGTAANVTYLGVLDQIRASGNVSVTAKDPQHLALPASLRSDAVTVDVSSTEYIYSCSGDPLMNDIDFTMLEHQQPHRESGLVAKPQTQSAKPPTQLKVHAYGFENAVLQTGSAVSLTGPTSHLDMLQVEIVTKLKTSDSQIVAPHISAAFSDTGDTLSAAKAENGVQFVFDTPTASGLSAQSLSGNARSLEYTMLQVTGQPDQRIDVMGRLSIKLDNPEELIEPALIEWLDGRVFHLEISKGIATYSGNTGENPITIITRPKGRPAKTAAGGVSKAGSDSSGKAP